ncbi:ORF V Enzymatic polyprotein [Nymphaea thermarum]|nr:ORF V Enzymatic polyprotein [Nymphaea thermarum]
MQDHVLKKIEQFSNQLEDKLQCQRFLGCLNYVGNYIQNLSQKTQAIRKVMHHEPYEWNKAATEAIIALKEDCQKLPDLEPTFVGPFVLSTDASNDTWAAVLLKKDGNSEKVCFYTSGQFKTHELNYWPAEKEILAAIRGLTKFHPYVIGEKFILRTYSQNLSVLLKRKITSSPKLQRFAWWQFILSQYDFSIDLVPDGKKHYAENFRDSTLLIIQK